MKRVLVPLAAVAAVLAPSGTAHAYPIADKALTANPLYSAGRLDITKCEEKRVRPGDAKLAKAYLYGVFDCLNKTWSAQLKKSGQTFRVPILKVVTKAPKRFCAHRWAKDTVSNYCEANRTILTVLTEEILEDPSDLWMYNLLASDYGQHVQNLTDIYAAYEDHSYRNKKELLEQNRRYELQSICFAGAFVRSTWDSLKRPTSDWPYVVKLFSDDWSAPDFGSRRSISYWANRGFSSGDPGSCNTWTASSKRVA